MSQLALTHLLILQIKRKEKEKKNNIQKKRKEKKKKRKRKGNNDLANLPSHDIKYLSKYIYKGPDRVTMEISGGIQDEIKAHLDGCFIGPTEACWKIFEFNMDGESLAVQHLPINLPNKHYVNFHAHQTVNDV